LTISGGETIKKVRKEKKEEVEIVS